MRRLLPYTTAAVVLAALYAAWTLYSRYQVRQEAERRAEQKTRQSEIESGKFASRILDGGLKILNFASDTGVVAPGGRVLLCYGVANAVRVTIDPQIKPLKPAITYCLEAFPRRTTTYKLTAEDGEGRSASASLTIRVDGASDRR